MENQKTNHSYCIHGVSVEFPCKPYGSQMALMDRILKSLKQQQNCLVESPTGSGKSLALLCSCLAWQKKQKETLAEAPKEDLSGWEGTFIQTFERNSINQNLDKINSCTNENQDTITPSTAIPLPSKEQSSTCCEKPSNALKRNNIIEIIDLDDDDFQPSKKFRTASSFASPLASRKKNEMQSQCSDTPSKAKIESNVPNKTIPDMIRDNNVDHPQVVVPTKKIPKIYFGTRTHKQIAQITHELKKTAYKDVKMCILSSRERTCIHPEISKSSTKNEDCKALLDLKSYNKREAGCSYHYRAQTLTQYNIKENYHLNEAWDIEDIVKLGKKIRACPYFGLKQLMQEADIVFCPYNYLIDPIIRANMEINLKGNIMVLDEAHNIEDSARDAASVSIKQDDLCQAIKDFEKVIANDILPDSHRILMLIFSNLSQIISRFSKDLTDYSAFDQAGKVWSGEELVAILKDINAGPDNLQDIKKCYSEIISEDKDKESYNMIKLTGTTVALITNFVVILQFLYKDNLKYMQDYRGVIVKTASMKPAYPATSGWLSKPARNAKHWAYTLNLWCLNPAVAVSDFKDQIHSLVVASGTLSPMVSFQSELGIPFGVQLEANHVIDDSQVWVGTLSCGPSGQTLNGTFRHSETFSFQDELGGVVVKVCRTIPDGVLCFLPSYSMMDKLVARWKTTQIWDQVLALKVVVCEPRGSNKSTFEPLMNEFYQAIRENEGAILFAVCRGKVSEGLDFTDSNARAVITVGIPFPNIKDIQVDLKKQYNNRYHKEKSLMSGNDWYETQGFRALNQALGRCIRHKNDWGALILVDERFQKSKKYTASLSKWMRNKLRHFYSFSEALTSLEDFIANKSEFSESVHDNGLPEEPPHSILDSSLIAQPFTHHLLAEPSPRTCLLSNSTLDKSLLDKSTTLILDNSLLGEPTASILDSSLLAQPSKSIHQSSLLLDPPILDSAPTTSQLDICILEDPENSCNPANFIIDAELLSESFVEFVEDRSSSPTLFY